MHCKSEKREIHKNIHQQASADDLDERRAAYCVKTVCGGNQGVAGKSVKLYKLCVPAALACLEVSEEKICGGRDNMIRENKNLLDYMAQTLIVFGVALLAITLFCFLMGDEAREYSSMFVLGSEGIPLNTVLQFLLDSACITVIRFLFFSDRVIRRMSVAKRTVGMVASVIVLTGLFAYLFGWFPIDNSMCWVSFLVSFGICFVISVAVSTLKESMDNKRLEEGLQHLKEKNLE